jgi:hypothetical protein
MIFFTIDQSKLLISSHADTDSGLVKGPGKAVQENRLSGALLIPGNKEYRRVNSYLVATILLP